MEKHKNKSIPIWEKSNLTLTEAAEYFNIGEHKLREITSNHKCNFVLFIGTKRLIKRKEFEKYLEQVSKEVGATVTIKKFVRFETGEGIEKKQEDFAAEVAAQL